MAIASTSSSKKDKPTSILVDGCFSLSLSFHLIAGKKKLNPEDIGLKQNDLPKDAISLGSKQVIPKDIIKELNQLKSDLLGYLSTIGFKIHGVWNVPLEFYEEVQACIDETEDKFIELKRHIILNVQAITKEWAAEVDAQKPGMGDVILRNAYSPEYIADKVQFEHIFWQNAQDVASLSLFRDVAETAKKQLDEIVGGKNKCSKASCLDRLIGIKKKLNALRFVDKNVDLIIQRIDRFVSSCPQKGKLPENFGENLAVELAFLANPEHLMHIGQFKMEDDVDMEAIKERLSKPNKELDEILNSTKPDVNQTPTPRKVNAQAELDLFSIC